MKELHCRELKVKGRYLKSFKSERVTQETRGKKEPKKWLTRILKEREKRIGPSSVQVKCVLSRSYLAGATCSWHSLARHDLASQSKAVGQPGHVRAFRGPRNFCLCGCYEFPMAAVKSLQT